MFAYEPSLEPPCNVWEEYEKPAFILSKIQEICEKIVQKGEKSGFPEIIDLLYEHIEEHLEKYLPEPDYDDYT